MGLEGKGRSPAPSFDEIGTPFGGRFRSPVASGGREPWREGTPGLPAPSPMDGMDRGVGGGRRGGRKISPHPVDRGEKSDTIRSILGRVERGSGDERHGTATTTRTMRLFFFAHNGDDGKEYAVRSSTERKRPGLKAFSVGRSRNAFLSFLRRKGFSQVGGRGVPVTGPQERAAKF